MQVFCYNPLTKRETLKEFNDRVAEFCLDTPVISFSAHAIVGTLVLGLTLADDVGADDVESVMPVVRAIEGTDVDLEEQIEKMLTVILAEHTNEDQRTPVSVSIVPRTDKPSKGWVVFTVINGSVDQGGEGGDDGEDTGGDEPLTEVEEDADQEAEEAAVVPAAPTFSPEA